MRAYTSMYEDPTFEDPTVKEQSVVCAALGAAAVAVASTVTALQIHGAPTWLTAAYVRTLTTMFSPYSVADLSPPSPCALPALPTLAHRSTPRVQVCKQPLIGTICRSLGVPHE